MKNNKAKLVGVGVIIFLAVVTGAVFMQKNKPAANTPPEPIKIALTPWVGNGPFYVAKAKGFFDKENVRVEFVNVDDTGIGKQLLSSGKIDAFYLTPETVVNMAAAGTPVKVFAATDRSRGADGIVADGSIKTVADLKGKSIAFEVGSPSHFLLGYLLRDAGLTTKDMRVVSQNAADAGAAFVAGKIPAAVTWEPYLTRAKEVPGGHLLASSRDVPVIYDMLIFREASVAPHSQGIKPLLRALFAAREWIYKNEADAAKIIADEFKITPEEAAEQMQGVYWLSYEDNMQQFTVGEYSVQNAISAAADVWAREGITPNKVDTKSVLDDSYLRNLYQ